MDKNSKFHLISDNEIVIPDEIINNFVPEEFKAFCDAYNNTNFDDGPEDYANAISAMYGFIDNTDKKSVTLKPDTEDSCVDENFKEVAKALAALYVAAYNKGVTLVVGYVYNDNESDIKFGLPSTCYSIRLTKKGREMAEKVGLTGNARLEYLLTD